MEDDKNIGGAAAVRRGIVFVLIVVFFAFALMNYRNEDGQSFTDLVHSSIPAEEGVR